MKKLWASSFLAVIASCSNTQEIDCNDLVGTWSGERYDFSMESTVSMVSTYKSDGTFRVQFSYTDGEQEVSQRESGYWTCDSDELVKNTILVNMTAIDAEETYRIVELSPSYLKTRLLKFDCSQGVGDCLGVVSEFQRLP